MRTAKPCDWHIPSPLGYIAQVELAEQRQAAGEIQIPCQDCGIWLWPAEYGVRP